MDSTNRRESGFVFWVAGDVTDDPDALSVLLDVMLYFISNVCNYLCAEYHTSTFEYALSRIT